MLDHFPFQVHERTLTQKGEPMYLQVMRVTRQLSSKLSWKCLI